jgi:hypothetical protein
VANPAACRYGISGARRLDLAVGGEPLLDPPAVVRQLAPTGIRVAERAEEQLEQHAVTILGLDRLDAVEPLPQHRRPGVADAEEPLVGPVGLHDVTAEHEPRLREALQHRVQLAARRRPDEADGPPGQLVQLVPGGFAAPGE